MTLPAYIYAVLLVFLIFFGSLIAIFQTTVNQAYVQHAIDSSTDAGATRIMPVVSETSEEGDVLATRFVIDEIEALTAAESTFLKNMQNINDLGLNVRIVELPEFDFPDDQSISGFVDIEHDLIESSRLVNSFFDEDDPIPSLDATIMSVSTIRKER